MLRLTYLITSGVYRSGNLLTITNLAALDTIAFHVIFVKTIAVTQLFPARASGILISTFWPQFFHYIYLKKKKANEKTIKLHNLF